MTPEARVKVKVKRILAELGAYYAMPATGGYGSSGVPDFLICHHGKFVAIECKANGGKTTALQEKHLADIRGAGGVSLIIHEANVENLRKELENVYEYKDPSVFGEG